MTAKSQSTDLAPGRRVVVKIGSDLLVDDERGTVHLEPGDLIVMFTDGVTEAMGVEEEEYTDARLQAFLELHHHESAQTLIDMIQADVEAFTGPVAVRSDDRTMIVLKVTG